MGELFNNPRIPFLELRFGDLGIPLQLIDHVRPSTGQQAMLEEAIYTETALGGGNLLEVTLFDPDYDRVEDLLIQHMSKIKFRFGWRSIPGRQSLEHTGFLWHLRTEILPMQGARVRVKLQDRGFNNLLQQGVTKAFTEKTISAMVAELADLNGIKDKVITPTAGNFTRRMSNTNPYKFITNDLLPMARTLGGRSNFQFFFIGPRLIFSPPDPNIQVRRQYLYGRDRFTDIISFIPDFGNAYATLLGGGNIKVRGFDPITKQGTESVQTDAENLIEPKLASKAVDVRPTQGDSTLARLLLPKKQHINRVYHVPFNTQKEVEDWAKYKRARAEQMRFTADAEVIGDPNLHPNDYIQILVVKTADIRALNFDRDLHRGVSGTYRVQAVTHTINAGGYTTSLSLFRENSFIGPIPVARELPAILFRDEIRETITKEADLIGLA